MSVEDRGAAALDALTDKKPKKRGKLELVKDGSQSEDGKPAIYHDPGKLPEILDQLGEALATREPNLYVFTNRLVRIHQAEEKNAGGVHRPRGTLILPAVDASHLTELATAAATHFRYDARGESWKLIDCPRRVAEAFLARSHWPQQRHLSGFIEAPTITADGRLIERPGYDEKTGLYLPTQNLTGWKAPKASPSMRDAQAAMDLLLAMFDSFPLVGPDDRAACVAGVISALIRRSIPAAPMVAVTAPTPGTGKTLIAETFALIATGRRASVLSLGHDDAEAEKRIAGMLMAGTLMILLDNIERPLKGDLLCQVLTQMFVQLRPLGASGLLQIPTNANLVATGNNLAIVGDLKRRAMLIRMDAGMERPEQRVFEGDHLENVLARRAELIRAALTIPLAYLAAGGRPVEGLYPLGGFEAWDRLVRRPLVWLGLSDPLKASESLRDQDPDLEAMRLMFSAWHEVFGLKAMTAAEVVAAGAEFKPVSQDYEHPELRDALQLICAEKPNTRRLGHWLRNHRDRIADGLQIKQAGTDGHAKVARWKVQAVGLSNQPAGIA